MSSNLNSIETHGIKNSTQLVPESNSSSLDANNETESDGFYLQPTQSVPGRSSDITGHVVTSFNSQGKFQWSPVSALINTDTSGKESVRCATTTNVDLFNPIVSIDGVVLENADRVLIKDQITQTENGIYQRIDGGFLQRTFDAAIGVNATGVYMIVTEGTINAETLWVCTDYDVEFGDAITFTLLNTGGSTLPPALQSIASLTTTSDEILYTTAPDTYDTTDLSPFVRTDVLPAANASALATALGYITGPVSTVNSVPKVSGSNTLTSSGVSIDGLDNVSGITNLTATGTINGVTTDEFTQLANIDTTTISSTQWGYLGNLDQDLATTSTPTFTGLSANSSIISNVLDPVNAQDAANKTYVDTVAASGAAPLESARLATAAILPDTPTYDDGTETLTSIGDPGTLSIDGIVVAVSDRILVKDQADDRENGVYVVTDDGSSPGLNWVLTRSSDFNQAATPIQAGARIFVSIVSGASNSASSWAVQSTLNTINPLTDSVVWVQVGGVPTFTAGLGIDSAELTAGTIQTEITSRLIYTGNAIDLDTVSVPFGGTGLTTLTSGNVLVGQGAAAIDTSKVAPTGDFVGTTDTQSLLNKTLTDSSNSITASGLFSDSGANTVSVDASANPSAGQVLTATDSTTAEWQTPSTLTLTAGLGIDATQLASDVVQLDTTARFTFSGNDLELSTVSVPFGGTGLTTLASGNVLVGQGGSSVDVSKAAPSGDFVGTSDAQTLTNKTMISSTNNVISNGLFSDSGANTVSTNASANPSAGQVLTAVDANTATWQDSTSPLTAGLGIDSTELTTNEVIQLDTTARFTFSGNDLELSTVTVPFGGTGNTSLTSGNVLVGQGAAAVDVSKAAPTGDFVGTTDTQTLTNKTLTDSSNDVTASGFFSDSGANTVSVDASANPSAGQILTAVNATSATWQDPAASPLTAGLGIDVTQLASDIIQLDTTARFTFSANDLELSTVTVPFGGTGLTSLTSGNVLVGQGASAVDVSKAAPAGDFVGTTDTQSLTNKTLTDSSNDVTSTGLFSNNGTNTVSVDASANPSAGQVLTAINATSAEWSAVASPLTAGLGIDSAQLTTNEIIQLDTTARFTFSGNDLELETVTVPFGGTGLTTLTSGNVLVGQGVLPLDVSKAAPVGDFVGTTDTQSLTNKTLTDSSNDVTSSGLFSDSGANTVSVNASANPSAGQILTAVNSTTATWQDPAASALSAGLGIDATQLASDIIQLDTTARFTFSGNDLELSTVTVPFGGTGLATLTSGNVLVGQGAAAVDVSKAAPTGDFVGTTDTQSLTNKTLTSSTNNVISNGLFSDNGSNTVSTSASADPTVGQVLTAVNSTSATWQNISSPLTAGLGIDSTQLASDVIQLDTTARFTFSGNDLELSTVTVPFGGTGNTSLTSGNVLVGQGLASVDVSKAAPTGDFVGTTDTQSLTNKTLTSSTNNVTSSALFSDSGANTISISTAADPSAGQVLTATSSSAANWQTPAVTSLSAGLGIDATQLASDIIQLDTTARFSFSGNDLELETVTVPFGGTGLTTLTSGNVLVGQGASAVDVSKAAPVGDFVGTTDTQSLTNKTLTDSSNDVTSSALFSNSGANTVSVAASANPTAGQVLTAINATTAEWADSASPLTAGLGIDVTQLASDIIQLDTTARFSFSGNDLELETVTVPFGGTGLTTLTSGNVLVGQGVGSVDVSKAAPTGDFVGTTDTQTLTNKTLTDSSNDVTSTGLFSNNGTNTVSVDASANPTAGQLLTAVDATTAEWQDNTTPLGPGLGIDVTQFNANLVTLDISPRFGFDGNDLELATVTVPFGGTGLNSLTSGNVLIGQGTSDVDVSKAAPTGDFVGTTDTQTLTNKTMTDPTNNVVASALFSGGADITPNVVSVFLADNPTAGQALIATNSTTAIWQDIDVPVGGTGQTTLTSGNVLVGQGTSPVDTSKAAPTGDFVGTTDAQTLTNKSITDLSNTVGAGLLVVGGGTTFVNISNASIPTTGQVLVATSSTTLNFETRNQLFYGIDISSGTAFTTANQTVTFTSTPFNDSIYSESSGEVTISETGRYMISYSVGGRSNTDTGNERGRLLGTLEVDEDVGSFSVIQGSLGQSYCRRDTSGTTGAQVTKVVPFDVTVANTIVRARFSVSPLVDYVTNFANSLYIQKLS